MRKKILIVTIFIATLVMSIPNTSGVMSKTDEINTLDPISMNRMNIIGIPLSGDNSTCEFLFFLMNFLGPDHPLYGFLEFLFDFFGCGS